MAYATAPISTRFDLAARIRTAAASVTEAWARYRQYQITYDELTELSDHELDDLGISRASLKRVAYNAVYGA